MRRWLFLLVFALVVVVGCAITDQQIEDISTTVERTTKAMIETGVKVAAPGLPLGEGALGGVLAVVAGAAAIGMKKLTRVILKGVQVEKK